MDKPRSPIESVYNFIDGKVSEETYLSKRSDEGKKLTYNWPELDLLQNDMGLFSKYLLAFSLAGRMKVLLRNQVLGISHDNLYLKYGIPKDKLRILKGQLKPRPKNPKAKIRRISGDQSISNELYATLAIFARVPISWIQQTAPKQIWSVDHFNYLTDASLSLEEFYDYLTRTEENALNSWGKTKHTRPNNVWFYDIRGVILKLKNSHLIYMRVAIYEHGGFLIEVFSENNEIYDFTILKDFLSRFGSIQTGYFETVIKERINPVIVCKSRSQNYTPPSNLKRF